MGQGWTEELQMCSVEANFSTFILCSKKNEKRKKTGASFTRLSCILTLILGISSYEIHIILKSNVLAFTFECQPELQWQILNKNICQKLKCVNFRSKFLQKQDFPYVSVMNKAPGVPFWSSLFSALPV
jgi:hypothetical protein